MQINILQGISGASRARGLTVIIDVYRAFTLECYAFAGGCERIIPVGDLDKALKLKKRHPDWLFIGERGGAITPGADFGNSPADIRDADLAGKTLIHTTSAGTQGLDRAKTVADTVITASFVNARAVADYIRAESPETVSIVAMGEAGLRPTDEDTLCAEYIRALLLGDAPDPAVYLDKLKAAGAHLTDPAKGHIYPRGPEDLALCLAVNRFDFVIENTDAVIDGQPIRLNKRVNCPSIKPTDQQ